MTRSPSQHSPASRSEAKGALLALFEAFPADRGEGTLALGTYLIAIEGYSLRAIEGAVKRIIRGEVSDIDRRFLPSPAQLGNVCAYLEKLYAPPEAMKALPAPGASDRTPEEQARIDAIVGKWRKDHGRERQGGEIITDREAVPAARLAKLDAAVEQAAAKLKAGSYRLSPEALATLDKSFLDSVAVDDPGTAYGKWNEGRAA